MNLPPETLNEIINNLSCGVIIMDRNRIIHYMNEAAKTDTGWEIGEIVPFCSYCRGREVENEEDRCVLALDHHVPLFQSEMAVYSTKLEEFEMSLKKIKIEDREFHMLQLRRTVENENKEQAYCSRLLVQETMHAQEMERRRIARELHDYIGQSVYSIFLGLEGIRDSLDENLYEGHLSKMINVMEKTLQDIKRLCKDLRPETSCHLGVIQALEEAAQDWQSLYQVEIDLEININEDEKFDRDKEIHLFRIIQEAVNNAVRHGLATHISIILTSSEEKVFFKVIDNGKGFDETEDKNKGLGLRHMYERCSMLGGQIHWVVDKKNLTIVEGFVSLAEEEEENSHERINRR